MIDKLRQLEAVLNTYLQNFEALKKENTRLRKEVEKLKSEKEELSRRAEEKISLLRAEMKSKVAAMAEKVEKYIREDL